MPNPHALAYSIEVVDKTGKAIHQSKTLFSAIKEARDAYKAKKAAKKEERRRASAEEEQVQRALRRQQRERETKRLTITEERRGSTGSAIELRERKHHSSSSSTTSSRRSGSGDESSSSRRDKGMRRMHSERGASDRRSKGLQRRATADDASPLTMAHSNASSLTVSTLGGTISEPSSPTGLSPAGGALAMQHKDDHLTALFTQCNDIFDSLSAFQFSVTTLIAALQRDPETLAVVGITLAEISSIITKLSPGVLATFKASWPMVFAFLSSPQFAIMAGVGIGTTVVLIGGYKIVKKLVDAATGAGTPAPKDPGTPIDLGGRVVGEVEVRELTAAAAPPTPPVERSVSPLSLDPPRKKSIAEHALAFGSSKKEKSSSSSSKHKEALAFGSSPSSKTTSTSDMAFGHDERSSSSRKKSSSVSLRSRSPPSRKTIEAPPAPVSVPKDAKVVPDLQFPIPKKHKHKSKDHHGSSASSVSSKDTHSRSDKSERTHKSSSREKEKGKHRER